LPGSTFPRWIRAIAVQLGAAAIALAWLCPGATAQGDLAALQGALGRALSSAGAGSSAYVYNLTSHQALFSARATVLRPPASIEKLYTATAALQLMGPEARLTTSVLGSGYLEPTGTWQGNLYLRGGGDPTFGSSSFIRRHYAGLGASVSTLAARVVGGGIRAVAGSVEGDESYLNGSRGEPSSGFAPDPFLEGLLSGLAFNRGEGGLARRSHAPAAYAARQLRAALRARGVRVSGSAGAAATPPAATPLAYVRSPTLAQLLWLMLPASDNFIAETLLKDLGARFAGAGTTGAGAAVVSQTIAELGLRPRIIDGSGLSPANRTSVYEVASLLVALAPSPLGRILRADLAVAGRSGTLVRRMRGTVAAGRCQAKTGTLSGVSNLAGYCQSLGGHLLAFVFFNDGLAVGTAHRLQDRMAIALASY
jgi:D-alanyl-D-alanine carboxypeptidase/D-alanyl-D-alanine-endopeptidase (penicillin-binding protein 4)